MLSVTSVARSLISPRILHLSIIALPTLTFNYILFQEKGIMDVQFSRFLLGDNKGIYQSIVHTIQPFSLKVLLVNYDNGTPGILKGLQHYWNYDIFLFLTFLIGIPIALKRNKNWTIYLLLLFTIPFIFLAGTSLLEKHFIFGVPIFCIFSSLTIDKISKFSKKNSKYIIFA